MTDQTTILNDRLHVLPNVQKKYVGKHRGPGSAVDWQYEGKHRRVE